VLVLVLVLAVALRLGMWRDWPATAMSRAGGETPFSDRVREQEAILGSEKTGAGAAEWRERVCIPQWLPYYFVLTHRSVAEVVGAVEIFWDWRGSKFRPTMAASDCLPEDQDVKQSQCVYNISCTMYTG
jgi:hypothetical protein